MDRQHPDSPMDPLTDPNFIMAMGLMNNIKVIIYYLIILLVILG